ncbi:MAG: bifunctional nuclease family protein [Persephonella sp.]|nr:MAG: bifunctional nuclease family protein [Persephonella sp.]RUM61338.1 MAG: bifunctional nuclease family protein [Persephonella sp.]
MIEMYVKGITVDPFTQMPILVLKGKETNDILPLRIGNFEGNSIALELEKVKKPRPLTYDLVRNILDTLNVAVNRIVISDMKDGIFYANIEIRLNGEIFNIDARPSDAINIALRCNSPIYVSKSILEKIKKENEEELDIEELEELIEVKEVI